MWSLFFGESRLDENLLYSICLSIFEVDAAREFLPHSDQPVGVTGFEPAALCSQSRCATKLRHTPISVKNGSLFSHRHLYNDSGLASCPVAVLSRIERDSNPRQSLHPATTFPMLPLKPLEYPSIGCFIDYNSTLLFSMSIYLYRYLFLFFPALRR